MPNKTNLNVEVLCLILLSTSDDKTKQDKRNKEIMLKLSQHYLNTKITATLSSEINLSMQKFNLLVKT